MFHVYSEFQLQLTYPEFIFETETKIDSLTDVQCYKGNYLLNGCFTSDTLS